jgi:hypothetical protein
MIPSIYDLLLGLKALVTDPRTKDIPGCKTPQHRALTRPMKRYILFLLSRSEKNFIIGMFWSASDISFSLFPELFSSGSYEPPSKFLKDSF